MGETTFERIHQRLGKIPKSKTIKIYDGSPKNEF